MTVSKTFFDTAPFIYLLENHPDFYQKVADFITKSVADKVQFETSVLTFTEFCVKPEQMDRQDLIQDFEMFLQTLDFNLATISLSIAKTAYKLRAKYSFLKGMDSLQVATAMELGCDSFFTNDKKLARVKEISVVVVSEL